MGKPVMFKTPSGEKMVVLALADYEQLVARADDPEDAADAAAFDEAMESLKSGKDRVLSPAEMEAYYARTGFLRGLRKGKGVTQVDLAAKAGLTQGLLSDIEAGRRNASPETIRKIAAALAG